MQNSLESYLSNCKELIKKSWQYDMTHVIVYSFLLSALVECLNRRSLTGLVMIVTNPVIFIYNFCIVLLTMSFTLLVRRKVFAYSVITMSWLILAGINYAVLCSRKTPFTAMDIYLLEDALKVIPVYLSSFQILLIFAGIVLAVLGLVWVWLKGPKSEKKVLYLTGLVKIAVVGFILAVATHILLAAGLLSTYFGNLAKAYQDYGFAYCFACSVVDRGINKMEEYSPEYMDGIKEQLTDETKKQTDETPNIIFLQLESFFDPNLVKNVTFSENPVPYFEKLVQEYASGYLSVPCFGAGTANTEFEVQTGMNIDDFGPGEYPYKTVLQSTVCESTAYDLAGLGYATHALHNNDGTFYDRYKVFSHLGYEDFTSVEYMQNVEETPMGWAKDKILTGEIEKVLNTTPQSDYIYTISVQGHGDYPTEYPEGFVPEITVQHFFTPAQEKAFTYYVNQVHEMDMFLQELTDMLSKRDENTVLVLYGDHLPGFEFTDEKLKNGDIYQTQYVIWSNFDLPRDKKDLESFQLSAYVLGTLGISEGSVTKFHQKQSTSEDYLKNLKMIEYDLLYGNCDLYGGKNPYMATNLQMGLDEIRITRVYNYKDYVCVEGSNFNDYSIVKINDKEYPTEIINGNLLRIKNASVRAGNIVSVVQQGNDKIELSRVYTTVK